MAAEDWIDDWYEGEPESEPVTCKRCGNFGFMWDWDRASSGWVLVTTSGKVHLCFAAARPSEFEVVNAPVA